MRLSLCVLLFCAVVVVKTDFAEADAEPAPVAEWDDDWPDYDQDKDDTLEFDHTNTRYKIGFKEKCSVVKVSKCKAFNEKSKCGDGYRFIKKKCCPVVVPPNGGSKTQLGICYYKKDFLPCYIFCRKVCKSGEWGPWSACNRFCVIGEGNDQIIGYRYRTKAVFEHIKHNCGLGSYFQKEPCNDHKCPRVCKVGDWDDWTVCNATCSAVGSYGYQTRSREVGFAKENGKDIREHRPGMELMDCEQRYPKKEGRYCNSFPCPQDCMYSAWTDWSPCSATCDSGVQTKTRYVQQYNDDAGQKCDEKLSDSKSCEGMFPCALHDLIPQCSEKAEQTILTAPIVCPYSVVICPGGKAGGYIKSCTSGQAWSTVNWGCVDESQICTDGKLNSIGPYPYYSDPWAYKYYKNPYYPYYPPQTPPSKFTCPGSGDYEVEGDCKHYYWCSGPGASGVKKKCPKHHKFTPFSYFKNGFGGCSYGSC